MSGMEVKQIHRERRRKEKGSVFKMLLPLIGKIRFLLSNLEEANFCNIVYICICITCPDIILQSVQRTAYFAPTSTACKTAKHNLTLVLLLQCAACWWF